MKNLITLILTIACLTTVNAQRNKKVKGNGNVVTIERNTGDYDGIRIGGFYEVELIEGSEGKITLEGEDNILEYVETEVRGGTLTIKSVDNMNLRTTKKVFIIVPVEHIDHIRLSGSGTVVSKKTLDADRFKVHTSGSRHADLKIKAKSITTVSSGSSHILLSGSADKIDVTSSGSSHLKAFELSSDQVDIKSSGSSNLRITVNESINTKSSGSSRVSYRGNPEKVNIKSSGSSKVIKNSEEL